MRTLSVILVLLATLIQQARIPGPGGIPPVAAPNWTLVQSCIPVSGSDEQTPSTTNLCTMGAATTQHNLILVFTKIDDTTTTSTPCTGGSCPGSSTETFNALTRRTTAGGSESVQLWYTCDSVGGYTAINAAVSTNQYNTMAAYEFSGNNHTSGTSCLDVETGGEDLTNPIGGSITTTATNDLIIESVQQNSYITFTKQAGFTDGRTSGHDAGNTAWQGYEQYILTSTTGSNTVNVTESTLHSSAFELASFKKGP